MPAADRLCDILNWGRLEVLFSYLRRPSIGVTWPCPHLIENHELVYIQEQIRVFEVCSWAICRQLIILIAFHWWLQTRSFIALVWLNGICTIRKWSVTLFIVWRAKLFEIFHDHYILVDSFLFLLLVHSCWHFMPYFHLRILKQWYLIYNCFLCTNTYVYKTSKHHSLRIHYYPLRKLRQEWQKMASKPGFRSDWPWKPLGNLKVQYMYTYIAFVI